MCPSGTTQTRSSGSLITAFHVIDADNDGRISRNDLRKFYTSNVDDVASDDVIGSMIHVADKNRDGYVEYEEFEKVVEERETTRRERERGGGVMMEEVFRKMDRDGDGIVGRDDLKWFLDWAGLQARDEDVDAMIRLGCVDDNPGVSFDGLLKILHL